MIPVEVGDYFLAIIDPHKVQPTPLSLHKVIRIDATCDQSALQLVGDIADKFHKSHIVLWHAETSGTFRVVAPDLAKTFRLIDGSA